MSEVGKIQIRRALVSVYDKTGLVAFVRGLHDLGVELLSTGGTARVIREAGLPVTMVEAVTGFPEMLDGRVKTLHPRIHAGILADRGNPDHVAQLEKADIQPIDMVVVSLYPFEKTVDDPDRTFAEAVEMIDIGGPCMLRAAAKNHGSVLVLCDPEQYADALEQLRKTKGVSTPVQRLAHAVTVFERTSHYDLEIERYLNAHLSRYREHVGTEELSGGSEQARGLLSLKRQQVLRYGENPHQPAALWRIEQVSGLAEPSAQASGGEATLVGGEQVSGGALSFNNYVDGEAALGLSKELTWAFGGGTRRNAVVFVKHTNPCGAAVDGDPLEAYRRAYLGDPIAAAGGVLVMNFPVTKEIAATVMETFPRWGKGAGAAFFKLDVWIAPAFDKEAVALIATPTQKRTWGATCPLVAVGNIAAPPDPFDPDFRKVAGGLLVQDRDTQGLNEAEWKVVTKRSPTEAELADLRVAVLINKHTKSNAITLVRDGMLLGNGAGQMSRVTSARLAVDLARELGHLPESAASMVTASDAFFPVPDGPQILIEAGVTAIIQPGGSKRDGETIVLCDERDVAMVFSATRHFRH